MATNRQRWLATGRRAFTLVELVVVIVIILLVTALILPSVLGALNDRKYSDATRTLQAVLLGARDRAIQSGNVVGVRLIRDDLNPFEVTQLIYVTVPEPYSVGLVTVAGSTVSPTGAVDPHFEQVDPGKNGTTPDFDDIPRVVPGQSSIRFDRTGKLYLITAVSNTPPPPPASLTISPVPIGVTSAPAVHEYQIFGAPAPMSQAAATLLPDGIVLDLRTPALEVSFGPPGPGPADRELLRLPRSLNIPNQLPPRGVNGVYEAGGGDDPAIPSANWPAMDILFAPNGSVTGLGATSPLIHFWLGERGDSGAIGIDGRGGTADDLPPNRPRKMVTLNTRTGLVVITDDPTPVGDPSNNYANVYGRAEQSLGVSVLP